MVTFRIFSRLDIKGDYVVKGIQLDGLRKIGDPRILAREYFKQVVDELVLVDVVASLYKRANLFALITEIAEELRIPLTAIGGIRSLEDAREVFEAGADKVGINSAAIVNPKLFSQLSKIYGNQSIVSSIEARRLESLNNWTCMTENGRNYSGITIQQWIPQLENLGVGEVFITSVDRDGTNKGPDFNLCKEARDLTDIPMMYSGGIRDIEDIKELSKLGFDGASIGSALHYKKINIIELKNSLLNAGVYVRTIGEMN